MPVAMLKLSTDTMGSTTYKVAEVVTDQLEDFLFPPTVPDATIITMIRAYVVTKGYTLP